MLAFLFYFIFIFCYKNVNFTYPKKMYNQKKALQTELWDALCSFNEYIIIINFVYF